MTPLDIELEDRIQSVYEALLNAPSHEQKRYCAQRMADLIGQRSPARIAEMERSRGLRH